MLAVLEEVDSDALTAEDVVAVEGRCPSSCQDTEEAPNYDPDCAVPCCAIIAGGALCLDECESQIDGLSSTSAQDEDGQNANTGAGTGSASGLAVGGAHPATLIWLPPRALLQRCAGCAAA